MLVDDHSLRRSGLKELLEHRGEMVVASAMGDLVATLTERERQVLDHVASGQSNKVIARALDISHNTVKLHVRHIMDKLNLRSRVEAAVFSFHDIHPVVRLCSIRCEYQIPLHSPWAIWSEVLMSNCLSQERIDQFRASTCKVRDVACYHGHTVLQSRGSNHGITF